MKKAPGFGGLLRYQQTRGASAVVQPKRHETRIALAADQKQDRLAAGVLGFLDTRLQIADRGDLLLPVPCVELRTRRTADRAAQQLRRI